MELERIHHNLEHLKMNHTRGLLPELIGEATRQKTSFLEFFDQVLTMEVQTREERRINASLKLSGLPKGYHLDNFDFLFQPSVEKSRIDALATCGFIRDHENVLFFGPPGVGKTHLAVGLGVRAVHMGYSVIHYTVEELMQQLKRRPEVPVAKQRGRAFNKSALVVLDELGYQALTRQETHLFFQFVSARYLKGSTIITSNRSVKEWVNVFADDEMATTAILDRLFHKAHLFTIDGQSYRLRNYTALLRGMEPKE
jgi:DNA replication protein DnaC